jgi:autoinducer 2-degrading protein
VPPIRRELGPAKIPDCASLAFGADLSQAARGRNYTHVLARSLAFVRRTRRLRATIRLTIGHKEASMLAIWVKVKVKPDQKKRFLEAIEADALGSERDEPGCLRFNVLQDEQDENTYYFYEVYKDQAALEAHRAAPHYAVWRAAADSLDGPTQATRCKPVFPANRPYWGKA